MVLIYFVPNGHSRITPGIDTANITICNWYVHNNCIIKWNVIGACVVSVDRLSYVQMVLTATALYTLEVILVLIPRYIVIVDMALWLYLCINNVHAMNLWYMCTRSWALYIVYATRWCCCRFWIMNMRVHKIEWYFIIIIWSVVGVVLLLGGLIIL